MIPLVYKTVVECNLSVTITPATQLSMFELTIRHAIDQLISLRNLRYLYLNVSQLVDADVPKEGNSDHPDDVIVYAQFATKITFSLPKWSVSFGFKSYSSSSGINKVTR